jgi:hypothetical protein
MSKVTNVVGKVNYISSSDRQEYFYAVHDTSSSANFWNQLADYNRMQFQKSGALGSCIEARQLIIALPAEFTNYDPCMIPTLFANQFKEKYKVECVAALHYNKTKTNYHVHLVFSERSWNPNSTEITTAPRNIYFNENGKRVRTKKEVTDANGTVRLGCYFIPKGCTYDSTSFSNKNKYFKSPTFLHEIKVSFTDLINEYVNDDKNKLQVFDRNSPYLPTKKIGKNNPKAAVIEADNKLRQEWNQTVKTALAVNLPMESILRIKRNDIDSKVKQSTSLFGKQPQSFQYILTAATLKLSILIYRIMSNIYSRIKCTLSFNYKGTSIKEKISAEDGRELQFFIPPKPAVPVETSTIPGEHDIKKADAQISMDDWNQLYALNPQVLESAEMLLPCNIAKFERDRDYDRRKNNIPKDPYDNLSKLKRNTERTAYRTR